MSKMVRVIRMNLAMMYLLDMGKVFFLYLCFVNLLHVLHALIRSFVDKITLIKSDKILLQLHLLSALPHCRIPTPVIGCYLYSQHLVVDSCVLC